MTTKQRAKLRSISQNLPDLVFIGKDGLTENVIKQIDDNLFSHELIKIKVQKNSPMEIDELCEKISQQSNCEVVSTIGSKIVLYKFSDKEKIKHIELN